MEYLALGIRCLIGAVFLASFSGKVAGRGAFDRFAASLRDMQVVPSRSTRSVARYVVAAECAVWVLLAVPERAAAVAGFVLAGGLLAVFAAGIALSLRQGVRAPCRCFGVSAAPLGPRHVVRNLTLTALAVTGAAAVPAAGTVGAGGAAVAASAGLLLGALVTVLDDILDLFLKSPEIPGIS